MRCCLIAGFCNTGLGIQTPTCWQQWAHQTKYIVSVVGVVLQGGVKCDLHTIMAQWVWHILAF